MILGVSASIHAKPQGQLNLLYWQAPSTMNPNLSGGTKELEASSVVLEPLARYDEKGNMIPWLVDEIPTVDNGGVSKDLTSITWKIKKGIKFSDGSELTAEMQFSRMSIVPIQIQDVPKPITTAISSL